MSNLALAAVLAITVLVASTISVEIGISVALIELALGVVVGNVFDITSPEWLLFVALFAGIVLTFLAGAEVDVPQLRREWRASVAMGLASFAAPFLIALGFTYWALDWTLEQAQIAGIALSTTSLAVVYAVLVESGLSRTAIGKRLMAATFVTDLGTVAALSILFVEPSIWLLPFAATSVALVLGLPRLSPWFFGRYGDRVVEPEIKLVFASLFLLMWLGERASLPAVLPAFVLGLALSGHYARHRKEQERLRLVAFAFLTPFFFVSGGLYVSLGALWANVGVLGLLFAAKMIPKLGAVYPLARRYASPHAGFTSLLMSTGLTFGTISALFGLREGILDETQFSLVVAVVVLSAIVPTVVAQRFFQPSADDELARERRSTLAVEEVR
ncbi:MAG TPA: cation:proton antiporter [Gaiellaceae bacterium]|nr:cation:proton antiporter [Gaiellaceae bacterium]